MEGAGQWQLSESVLRWPDAERLLRDVSPAVARVLDELEREWDPVDVPGTLALADIARLLPGLGEESAEKQRLLGVVERMILEGDSAVSAAATTGFCEALLNLSDAGEVRFPLLVAHAGPETLNYCAAWDTFTGARTPGFWEPPSQRA